MSEWWRDAVFYEIYIRSFADSDGDGIGDLQGIRSRLPYLRALGVDALWVTPFYPSPGADHGYDVSDYVGVDPQFGTLGDFDALVSDVHALDLRVVVDLVANHTSREHPWFRDRPEFYVWADEVPNNWQAIFGGPAWSRDERTGRWYLHLFAPEQPDLDWHNRDVQAEFESILRFWLDRGADGFRIDVAHGLFKDPELRDDPPRPAELPANAFDHRTSIDRPELHPLYRRWRALADSYPGERLLLGEVFLRDQERVAEYLRPGELQLAFNFMLLWQPWDAARLRAAIDATLAALSPVGATPTWVLESHDVERLPTRYGAGAEGLSRARASTLVLLALPGTAFLYAGQELGLEEVDLPDEVRQDPVLRRSGGERKGRDGCRVPLPWKADRPGLGFTSGDPWLPMPPAWASLAAAEQERDPRSTLALYRAAIGLRPELTGRLVWRESPPGTLVFDRGPVTCAVNVDAGELELPAGECLLASDPDVGRTLAPGTAAWVRSAVG